ncbi:D-alanyl-D-alanine carboxypeptidase family protein [Planotetraspora phitsanulokensis]|nr:D-alanyl-D-alanine carboxypeptidase family protein [Planotetraspora phitsanulokensis]
MAMTSVAAVSSGRSPAGVSPGASHFVTVASETAITRATSPQTAASLTKAETEAAGGPSLTTLRRQAQEAYKAIGDASKQLDARKKQFDSSQKKLASKLRQLAKANQELSAMRKPLSDLVESVYQNPSATGLGPLLAQGDGTSMLRAMSDVDHLAVGRNKILDDAVRLLKDKEKLANEAQDLRSANLLEEAQLDHQVDTLRTKSADLVKSLTQTLSKMGVKVNQGHRGAGACDPTRISTAAQYPNGLLPKSSLCPLPQAGRELRADAAIAFADLNLAYQKNFGKQMCVTDSYRSLASQQAVYYSRPGFAAVPGRSNHGLGLAVDLCGGVQNSGSAQFNWLEANSKRYGFIHPPWAYSNPFEPWHWEYDPKLGAGV